MPARTYLANVGANSSHRYSSPVFEDGTFELLPIPESPAVDGPHAVHLGDVPSWNTPPTTLRRWVPERLRGRPAHFDPEFGTVTYGDNCGRAPRAAALKSVSRGDRILFIARLSPWAADGFIGRPGFYLVGFIEVDAVLRDVRRRPDAASLRRFAANAHVRKALNDSRYWDGFWVFGGTARSARFRRAVPVDRPLAVAGFTSACGAPWSWHGGRTDLQVIGSYTRSCRCIIDPALPGATGRSKALWERIRELNPEAIHDDLAT